MHKSLASVCPSRIARGAAVAIKREGLYFNLWRLLFKLLSYIRQLKIPPSCRSFLVDRESRGRDRPTSLCIFKSRLLSLFPSSPRRRFFFFFFNFLRRAFLRGRSGSSYVVASLRNRKSPARSPVASAWFLTLYLGVRREEEEGGGMLSSLLITILCDSLSWFVTVARLKERSAGWGTRMALAWARRGATRTERRREKEREKKIGVLRSARKLVISWNEIFFSRVSLVAGSDRPRSPRDSSVRPAERSMDRQFRSSQSSERSADLLLSFSVFSMDQLLRATKTIYDHHISS